ncbi:MAG: hypothetical protein H9W81_13700 [Enterococcus sp.]|nr:hypothetical protein [Enterococcus sp.]
MDNIKDVVMNSDFFATEHDSDEDYDTMISLLANQGISLPSFAVIPESPAPRKVTLLDNGKFAMEGIDAEWDSVETLYDSTLKSLHFDDSVEKSSEVEHKMDQFLFLKAGEDGTSRLLMGRNANEELMSVAYAYYQFLVAARKWYQNPADFFASYDFLTRHPAFWHLEKSTNPVIGDSWVTDDGLTDLTIFTFVREADGKHYVGLEAGGVVRPENTRFWRNDGMDIFAPTMDQAYIDLAAALDKQYDLAGNARDKSSEG